MSKQDPWGSSAEYTQRLYEVYRSAWQGQIEVWKAASQLSAQPFSGQSPRELAEVYGRAAHAWRGWVERLWDLYATPRKESGLPILRFVIDAVAETSPLQSVRLRGARIPRTALASDLFPVERPQGTPVSGRHLSIALAGLELSVGLVDLGHGKSERERRHLAPGRYSAVVFEDEPAAPLALVEVQVLP